MDDGGDDVGRKKSIAALETAKPNFYTNPSKRGGPGVPGVLLSHTQHMDDDFEAAAKQRHREELLAAQTARGDRPPFKSLIHPQNLGGTFARCAVVTRWQSSPSITASLDSLLSLSRVDMCTDTLLTATWTPSMSTLRCWGALRGRAPVHRQHLLTAVADSGAQRQRLRWRPLEPVAQVHTATTVPRRLRRSSRRSSTYVTHSMTLFWALLLLCAPRLRPLPVAAYALTGNGCGKAPWLLDRVYSTALPFQRMDGMLAEFPEFVPDPLPERTAAVVSKQRQNDEPPEWRRPSPAKARPVSSILTHPMNLKIHRL